MTNELLDIYNINTWDSERIDLVFMDAHKLLITDPTIFKPINIEDFKRIYNHHKYIIFIFYPDYKDKSRYKLHRVEYIKSKNITPVKEKTIKKHVQKLNTWLKD